jgi:hypothetical protein
MSIEESKPITMILNLGFSSGIKPSRKGRSTDLYAGFRVPRQKPIIDRSGQR